MKHLTEPFSVAWSCFALPFETWKIQGLENGPRLVLFIDLFFWYLQSPLRSIDFYFWHGTDGRTDGGETEGTLRVPRRPKNESTLQWNLRWLSSEQSKMNDSSACKMFHCFSPCPAGAPYPPALIKQRCTLPLIKQRGSTDVMVQNFCWPSQPTNWVKMSPAVDLCCKNWLPPLHLGFNSYWRYVARENLEIVDN